MEISENPPEEPIRAIAQLKRVVLPVSTEGGGVLSGVDLNCSAELLDVMERERKSPR